MNYIERGLEVVDILEEIEDRVRKLTQSGNHWHHFCTTINMSSPS